MEPELRLPFCVCSGAVLPVQDPAALQGCRRLGVGEGRALLVVCLAKMAQAGNWAAGQALFTCLEF